MTGRRISSRSRVSATRVRRRLDPDARREQLVRLGLELMRARPIDRVPIGEVAAAAGISKGLLFHYFPTKRAFHAAVIGAAVDELLQRVQPDPDLPPLEQLRTGLSRYIEFIEEQPGSYMAVVRGAGSDPALLELFERTREAVVDLIVDRLDVPKSSPALRIAVRGYVAMLEESSLAWIKSGGISRDQLVDQLVAMGGAMFQVLEVELDGEDESQSES